MRARIAGFGNFVTIGGKDEKLPAEMEGCLGFWLWDPKRKRALPLRARLKTF